jgi:hypothetical protein
MLVKAEGAEHAARGIDSLPSIRTTTDTTES